MDDYKFIEIALAPCYQYMNDTSCTQENFDNFFASQEKVEILVILNGK